MITQNRFWVTISRYFAFYTADEFKKYIADVGLKFIDQATHREDDKRQTAWLGFFVQKV